MGHRKSDGFVCGQLLGSDLTRKLIDDRVGDLMSGKGESGISESDATGELFPSDPCHRRCFRAHQSFQSSPTILLVLHCEQGKERRRPEQWSGVGSFAGWAPYLSCDGDSGSSERRQGDPC